MSKTTDGADRVITKEVDVKRAGEQGQSTKEQLDERRAAIEQDRQDREKSRRDFMLTGKGKASDHFELVTNRETVERYTNQDGAPQTTEELSESAREKWLRTGELPEKKPNGKAAEKKAEETQAAEPPTRPKFSDFRKDGEIDQEGYEAALDRYELERTEFQKRQAERKNAEETFTEEEIDKNLDKEIFQEISARQDWWNEEGHADAHKALSDRTVAAIKALSPEEKNIIAASPVRTLKLHDELDRFLGHAMARLKNLGRVHVELARDPGMLQRMNEDWVKSEKDPKLRWSTQQSIRYVLKHIDKKAGSASNDAKPNASTNGAEREPVRKLTSAGKPPIEAAGASSSPADDGSSDAAWKRKDLSAEEKGELYRERKNREDADARRKRHPRRSR